MVFSCDWEDWDQVAGAIRAMDHSVCLFLRDPNPIADRMAIVRGLETFFFQGPYPNGIGQIWKWGNHPWDFPQIPVWDPVAQRYLCHRCGLATKEGIWCSKECTIPPPPTPPRTNSFQSVTEPTDEFLSNCCKTFVELPKDSVFEEKKHASKFMQTMLSKIERKEYLDRKELFRKQLRSQIVEPIQSIQKPMCKAQTKKGKSSCTNRAIDGSDYCGIPSHKKLSQVSPQELPQQPSQ